MLAAKADDRMMLGKEVGKLITRVRLIERDLRASPKGVASMAGEEE